MMTTKTETKETEPVSFPAQVWAKMSRIDVSNHIMQKEGGFSADYLPWSWAYSQMIKAYPESSFKVLPDERFDDGTVLINIQVTVRENGNKLRRQMYLPVMTPKMQALQNPNARQISDTRMRCLVKCIALFGLGIDLWTKSDFPVGAEDDPIDEAQADLLTGLFDKLDEDSQTSFLAWVGVDSIDAVPVGKYKPARVQLERKIKALKK
jgi:hypothetical protein